MVRTALWVRERLSCCVYVGVLGFGVGTGQVYSTPDGRLLSLRFCTIPSR